MARNISRVTINAAPEEVWETLTNPELVKLWQYGSVLITDWQPGSAIAFETEWEGKTFRQWGKVLEFEPHHRIVYSLFAPRPGLEDQPENYFKMHYLLRPDGNHTRLEIIHEDERPGAKQEPDQDDNHPVLKSLKSIAEKVH